MSEVKDVKGKGAPLEAGAGGALPWLWFFGLSRTDGGSILGSLRGAAVLLIGLLLGFPAGGQAQTTITAERYDGTTWQSVTSGSENIGLTRLTGSGYTIDQTTAQIYAIKWCLRSGKNAGTADYETDWGFRSSQTSPRNTLFQDESNANNLCTNTWQRRNVPTVEKWLDITDDNIDEPDETIKFSIAGDVWASGSANFQYTIKDNDPTIVSLAKVGSATTLTEGDSLRFTVTLGRELVAGEVIDVPLSISGTNVTTGDWSLSLVPGSAVSGINTGVTLSGAATATPKLTFSNQAAQVATLEWRAIAEDPAQLENPETVTIALGPDGSGTNGFDSFTDTNVGGGADPHGSNNEFSITVEDLGYRPVTIEMFPFENTEEMVDIREDIQTEALQPSNVQVELRATGFTLPTDGSTWSWTWCVRTGEDAGTATYGTDWVFATANNDLNPRQLTNNCYSGPAGITSTEIIGIFAQILITDDMIDEPTESIKVSFAMTGGATGEGNYTVNIIDDDPTIVSLTSQFGENTDGSNRNGILKEGNTALFYVSLGRALVAEEVIEMSLLIGGTNVTTGDWDLYRSSVLSHSGITLHDADTATPKLRFSGAGAQRTALVWRATPDKIPESTEVVTIALVASQSGTNVGGGATASGTNDRFRISVEDPSIAITETDDATAVTEAAGESRTDTYTVVLKAQPSAGVEVAVASSDTATATVSPASLSFSTSDWNMPQTVTVTALDDHLDQGNRTVTITHAATSTDADYNEIFIRSVTATVVDDDRAGLTITHSDGSTTVTEAAGATRTDTYTVALSSQPTHGVELTLSSYRSAVATVSPTSLTFTTTNWNTAQTVTVTAGVDDNVDQGGFRRSAIVHTVAATQDSTYASAFMADAVVTLVDDDTSGVTITESGGSTAVTEAAGAGNTDTYTVVLDTKPTAAVEVETSVVAHNRDRAMVSPATLTFTTGNWNTAQTVTVTGTDDNVDQPRNRRLATITNRAFSSGGNRDRRYDRIPVPNVIVTVVDDDGPGVTIIESMGDTRVTEASGAGKSDTYTVVLNRQPGAGVEIAVASGDTGAATVSPATLTFTTTNWNTAQAVTVTGVDNTVARDTRRAVISHTATSTDVTYSGIIIDIVAATVVDDDGTGATINESNGSTSVTEAAGAGNTDTYTVVLDTRPSASVEIVVASDMAAATVNPATLTFTTTNWNTAQTVTVTGVDDNTDQTGKRTATISHTATSTDANYEGVHIDDVAAAVVDDDGGGVTIIESNGSTSVTEAFGAGNTDTYTVVLDSLPVGTVAIHVLSSDPSLVTASPAALTFTTGNWNMAQTVTVTGMDDGDTQTGDSIAIINHVINTSDGGDYFTSRTIESVTVTLVDDDLPVISISLPTFEGLGRRGGLYYFPEGEGLFISGRGFSISASLAPTQDLTICLNLTETGANRMVQAGDQGKGLITFTLPANTPSADQSISWSDNSDDDQNSQVTLTAVPPSDSNCSQTGYTVSLTEDSQSWFIEDDDPTVVELTSSDTRMSEGNASATATATITLSRPLLSGEMINLPLTFTTTTGADLPGSATPDFAVSATGKGVTTSVLTSTTPTVTLAGADSQTVQTALVTFTPTNRDDGDSSHEAINAALPGTAVLLTTQPELSLSNLGGRATRGTNFDVDLTLEDDEAPTVQFGAASYSGGEASGSRTVNVGLTASPTFGSATSLTYNVGGTAIPGTDYTALSGTLSMTGGSGTITITITDDQVDDADETIVLTLTPSNDYSLGSQESTTITIADDDAPAVNIMETDGSTEVDEGRSNDTYTVVLNSPPTHAVEISTSSEDATIVTASPATLTFTTTNWNTAQTVTLTGVDNDIIQHGRSAAISHTATSSDTRYNGIDINDVTVTVFEDDRAGLRFTGSATISVTEASGAGQTDTYTVRLQTLPTADVEIIITSDDEGSATVSPATLTFTSGDWNTPQTVTVTGVDDNVDQDDMRTFEISHAFRSTDPDYKRLADGDVSIPGFVTVTDNDTSAVTIAETSGSTSVSEASGAGRTDTYTVVLATLPSASVNITVTSGDTAAATVSPATLTFTTGNGNTPQTVTVTGVDDNVDQTSNRSATITHVATSTDTKYNGIIIASVTATVVDNDESGATINELGGVSVTEAAGAGRTDTYTVVLATLPSASVEITVTSGDTAKATVSPSTLTFTTGNWNTPQTVTVTGVDDNVDQTGNRSATISHSATSTDTRYNGVIIASVTATLVDNDGAGVTINEFGGVSVTEAAGAGRTDTYTVVLATLPSASVEITVTSGDTAAATVSPSTLTFTTGNWNTAQTVTVTGVDDNLYQSSDRRATISHGATSSDSVYQGITIVGVTATVVDDDAATIGISDSGGVSVSEAAGAGRTDTYTVVLDSLPTASVEIAVASGDTAAATVSPAALTFTTGNWNTAQTVTVTGVDDNIDQGSDRMVAISHTATSSDTGYNGVSASVTVTVVDDDTASIAINESGGVMVTEATGTDRTDTYTATLASQPTASVEIAVTSGDTGAATVSPAALTFTASNWQTAQTVTVTGVDDGVDQSSNRMVAISHTATSTDTGYNGLSASVTATVVDNDTAGVTITESGSPPATSVDEFIDGLTDTYTVVLDSEPAASVEIAVTSGDVGAATVSPATLTFTASNWQTAQTVTVTGVDDGTDQSSDRTVTISHSAASTDPLYSGIGIDDVTVTVVDDDMVGVTIIETDGTTLVTEASGAAHTDHYTVALGNRPTSTVTITMGLNAPGAVTVSPATLSFTTSSWRAAQTVTVTAVDDEVDQEERRTVRITHPLVSSDARYTAIPTPRITAVVVDDDSTGVTLSRSSASAPITVTEAPGPNHSESYTLVMTAQPMGDDLSIAVASSDPTAATVSPATLTFTPSNWNTPQTVTVTGVDDGVDQSGNRTVTITHTTTSDNGQYRSLAISHVLATVVDNDMEVSITADDHDGTITEGEAARFTLTATPAPAAEQTIDVDVRITDSGSFAVSSQVGSRVFTITASGTLSFSIPTEDDMHPEGDGRITATVETGRGYRPHSSNASASITVEDDFDAPPSVIPSTEMLTVTEGDTASYTIALDAQPVDGVTVSISARREDGTVLTSTAASPGRSPRDASSRVDGEAVVNVNPSLFTFRPTDWSTPQAVAITVPAGEGFAGETITLSHTIRRGNYQGPMTDVLVGIVADGDAAALVEQRKRAWHLRFGRTVSQQVVDALQQRLTTPPETGLELTVAGETLTIPTASSPLAEHEGLLTKALGFNTVTSQTLVQGSSFKFAPPQQEEVPRLGFWGQGALSSFDGEKDGSSLEGDVTTLLLGTDWSTGRWQAGAALSQSWGSGSYEGDNEDVADGRISNVLTGVFPYGRYALTPRLGLWATAGYGWGELSLEPDGDEDDYTPGTTMAMTAAGLDGALLNGGNGAGITLNATADVMTVKTTSEEADGLPSSEGLFSRLRLGLETARPFPLPQGASLLPSMEVGMRYDSGDAETGYGLDLGAAILWSAPEYGISGELKGHTLLTHQEEAFREQGLTLSFSWEPDPSDRGPSLSLSHTMGATASGGMDALLNPTTIQVLDASTTTGQQFAAELAYGFPAYQDRITLTPAVALALSPTSRNYSLLWSVAPYAQHQQRQGTPWEVSLEGERQEENSSSPAGHSLKLRFSTLF